MDPGKNVSAILRTIKTQNLPIKTELQPNSSHTCSEAASTEWGEAGVAAPSAHAVSQNEREGSPNFIVLR